MRRRSRRTCCCVSDNRQLITDNRFRVRLQGVPRHPLHSRARCTPCPAKSRSLFFHFGARHDEAGYSSSHTSVSFALSHFPLILLSIIREAGNWCASTLLGPRARQVLFENWNALRLNHDVSQKKPCISENCAYNSNGHNWIRISCLQSNACAEFLAKLLILRSRTKKFCCLLYAYNIQLPRRGRDPIPADWGPACSN